MCTVSFLPEAEGFHLLMNRDEQRSRSIAIPPSLHSRGGRMALYPSEPGGGTWMGINDRGMTMALINWYSRPQLRGQAAFSRGEIIPRLLTRERLCEAHDLLLEFSLNKLNPFRLIGISPREQKVQEWRSDAVTLEMVTTPWERTHWFSSGFKEADVSRVRANTVAMHFSHTSVSPREQLSELHRSHEPERGAYSLCMHRDDACTVSCTGLSVTRNHATMTYCAGSPCKVSVSEQRVLFFNPLE